MHQEASLAGLICLSNTTIASDCKDRGQIPADELEQG